jgi:hypothetical protein
MPDRRPEPTKPKPKAKPEPKNEQKKTETTILSPEELRAISGGVGAPNPGPLPGVVIKKP